MKKNKKLLALALAAITVLSGCTTMGNFSSEEWQLVKEYENSKLSDTELWKKYRGDYDQYDNMSDDEFWNAVFMEEIYPEALQAAVNEANSTASTAKHTISYSLVELDVYGLGMKRSESYTQVLDIIAENGKWSCNAVNSDNFLEGFTDSLKWGEPGSADSSTEKENITNAESLICLYLSEDFPDIENASFKAYLCGGVCTSVIFIEDITSTIKYGEGCPDVAEDGAFIPTYEWDGEIAGINANGTIIGTAPTL